MRSRGYSHLRAVSITRSYTCSPASEFETHPRRPHSNKIIEDSAGAFRLVRAPPGLTEPVWSPKASCVASLDPPPSMTALRCLRSALRDCRLRGTLAPPNAVMVVG